MTTKEPITQSQIYVLQRELINEYGRTAQLDGILNQEIFNKTSPRILWVLKEGNWGEDFKDSQEDKHDLNEEEINQLLTNLTADKYYENVTVYKYWKQTFVNICYVTYGILNQVYSYDDMADIDKEAKIDGQYCLANIAFINLKKCPGGSRANGNKILNSYVSHKTFIQRQIDAINPDIIFNCSGVACLTTDLAETGQINDTYPFPVVVTPSRLIIQIYHPNQMSIGQREYVDAALAIVEDYVNKQMKT